MKAVQARLAADGALIEADGVFGRLTQAALMAWQARHGMAPTGVVDEVTRGALARPHRITN